VKHLTYFLVKDEHSTNLLCINKHLQAKTNSFKVPVLRNKSTSQRWHHSSLSKPKIKNAFLRNIFLKIYNTKVKAALLTKQILCLTYQAKISVF